MTISAGDFRLDDVVEFSRNGKTQRGVVCGIDHYVKSDTYAITVHRVMKNNKCSRCFTKVTSLNAPRLIERKRQ